MWDTFSLWCMCLVQVLQVLCRSLAVPTYTDTDTDIDTDTDTDTDTDVDTDADRKIYGVATISRLLKMIGLICTRAP